VISHPGQPTCRRMSLRSHDDRARIYNNNNAIYELVLFGKFILADLTTRSTVTVTTEEIPI